ncbi:MAG TPA: hypothetical protein VH396_00335 [Chitinophagaceae bacterium]|jgi:hypothetical protein
MENIFLWALLITIKNFRYPPADAPQNDPAVLVRIGVTQQAGVKNQKVVNKI